MVSTFWGERKRNDSYDQRKGESDRFHGSMVIVLFFIFNRSALEIVPKFESLNIIDSYSNGSFRMVGFEVMIFLVG